MTENDYVCVPHLDENGKMTFTVKCESDPLFAGYGDTVAEAIDNAHANKLRHLEALDKIESEEKQK